MTHDSEPAVLQQRIDDILLVTLNRPDQMNAMNGALVAGLESSFRAAATSDVRAVVLTGAGGRAFCVGADLKERQTMSENEVAARLVAYRTAFDAIANLGKPVVCAINGYAFGGGLELALACDFRIAASTATVGLTELALGIIPGAGGTQRLARLIGATRAKELIFSAKRMSAADALDRGIVCRVSDDDLIDDALAFAREFEQAAPIALAQAKRAIDRGIEKPLNEALEFESQCYAVTLSTDDRLEGLAAFKEKRKPVWRGE